MLGGLLPFLVCCPLHPELSLLERDMPSGVYKRTKEQKNRIRELSQKYGFQKGHKVNVGRPHSAKTRGKIGRANKGNIPWCKGLKLKPHSEEAKEKNRQAHLGNIPWNKGKTGVYSEEVIKKISKNTKDKTYEEISGIEKSKERKKNLSKKLKGRIYSEDTIRKLSEAHIKRWDKIGQAKEDDLSRVIKYITDVDKYFVKCLNTLTKEQEKLIDKL